ncbi:MAG: hypothetical protein JO235_00515 [Chroococcidiopsidaceae cyanobacterium CP_BM_RX_35]|nr:hypothetical protein [Chroococcidiopsidaceae cyanobacterium CP_BM_RX_35]
MERGLLWLPLLALFIWLTWQGWNEYQKVEAYRHWAQHFERAKYDIYAVLGQNGSNLTWGKPTRAGPIDLETFSLKEVQSIHLLVDDKPVAIESPPSKGKAIALEFTLFTSTVHVPFTEIALAAEWGKHLQQERQRLQLKQN